MKQAGKRSSRALRLLVAGGIVLATILPATAAVADDLYPGSPGLPGPRHDPGVQVQGAATSSPSGSLPFTGGDVAGLATIGAGAAAAGGVLVSRTRRRRRALI